MPRALLTRLRRPRLDHRPVRTLAAALTLLAITAPTAPLGAQIAASEFAARRDALVAALPDGVFLALGNPEPVLDYVTFHQDPYFNYLTGFDEPGASLVIVTRGSERREFLFVQGKDPAREVWTGNRLGVAGVRPTLGLEGRDAANLAAVLDSLLAIHPALHVAGDIGRRMTERSLHDQFLDAVRAANPRVEVVDARRTVDQLRGRKSAAELDRLRLAGEITARGHLAALELLTPGIAEFELQAAAEYVWRREGGDGPSYGSIVGSGPNATTLHYNRDDRTAQDGELIVMDLATYFDGYAADLTRTVPVNGRFSPAQRAVYKIVLAAQLAAERQVRVGGPARAMSDSATAVLAAGLTELGLIESPDATYECGTTAQARNCPQLSLYYMHGLGHGIGLVVHDPDQYTRTGRIDVGSAFTIEPGLYVRRNLLDIIPDTPRNKAVKARIGAAVARYADIGVRIEDDYLVTETGIIRSTAAMPREIAAIEQLLAAPRRPRDPAVVDRYRRYRTGRPTP